MEEYEEKAPDQSSDSLESASPVIVPTNEAVPTESPTTLADAAHESLESDTGAAPPATETPESETPAPVPPKRMGKIRALLGRVNIFLMLFVFVIVLAGVVVSVVFITNRNTNKSNVKTQSLTEDTLKQLANSDVTVGQPKQVLNVQSNAVFAGKVLINDSLEVAGGLRVGSNLTLPGITVSGNSTFDQVQISKSLSVAGDTAFQGSISTQKSLSVAGGGSFGGTLTAPQITANSLLLNGDLTLTHHITIGGVTPSRSNGGALGSGGTSSVSGSDSAGSININTGAGAGAGCFITVNFAQRFNATPHVLLTPVGSSAAGLAYYVNRSTTSFSVCTTSTPPSGASFGFDYFILD